MFRKIYRKSLICGGVLRIVTKTLQNGSRQLRTDRNLLRNSTDRPKNKACVTGSDSFRKKTNRILSRSRERNPKTGTDNHNIENQHCRATCLAVLHIYDHKKTPCKIFRLAGCNFAIHNMGVRLEGVSAGHFYYLPCKHSCLLAC